MLGNAALLRSPQGEWELRILPLEGWRTIHLWLLLGARLMFAPIEDEL